MSKVTIAKTEYMRLKSLEKRVGHFVDYLDHLRDIRQARREAKTGQTVPQEKLFHRLGL